MNRIALLLLLQITALDYEASFVVTPQQLNGHGTLFGGEIFSRMDQAAGMAVRKQLKASLTATHGATRMASVEFLMPATTGDVVTIAVEVVEIGKKSLTMKVVAEKELPSGKKAIATGRFVFVSVKDGVAVEHGLPEKMQ